MTTFRGRPVPSGAFYHGTSTALDIQGELLPPEVTGRLTEYRKRRKGKVFFTQDLDHAWSYARRAVAEWGGSPVVLLVEPYPEVKQISGREGKTAFHAQRARVLRRITASVEDLSEGQYEYWDYMLDGLRPFDSRLAQTLGAEPATEEVQGETYRWVLVRMPDLQGDEQVYIIAKEGDGDWLVHNTRQGFLDDAYVSPEEWLPPRPSFSEDFWESPSALYHASPCENYHSILENGLNARNATRGVSNRGVGSAVFTVLDDSALHDESYGDCCFEIDTHAMKVDGFIPDVEQEPDVGLYEQWSSLLSYLDDGTLREYLDPPVEIEGGMFRETVIVYANIPTKYLTLVWGEPPEEPEEEEDTDESWW